MEYITRKHIEKLIKKTICHVVSEKRPDEFNKKLICNEAVVTFVKMMISL